MKKKLFKTRVASDLTLISAISAWYVGWVGGWGVFSTIAFLSLLKYKTNFRNVQLSSLFQCSQLLGLLSLHLCWGRARESEPLVPSGLDLVSLPLNTALAECRLELVFTFECSANKGKVEYFFFFPRLVFGGWFEATQELEVPQQFTSLQI